MSWILLADCHFHKDNLQIWEESAQWILSMIDIINPTNIIFLGDTLHTRESVNVQTLQYVLQFLRSLRSASSCRPDIHLLVGNHDMSNLDNRTVNSPSIFHNEDAHVYVYSDPTKRLLDGVPVLFMPFHHNQSEITDYIKSMSVEEQKQTIMFAHIALDGAKINGISNESNRTFSDPSLTLSHLKNFQYVFSGHFHHHAKYGANFMYVGSPMQFHFGDADQTERGFVHYNAESGEMQLHVNPYAVNYIKMNFGQDIDADLIRNKHVKVTAPSDANIHDLDLYMDKVKQYADVVTRDKLKSAPSVSVQEISSDQLDHHETVKSFVQQSKLTETQKQTHSTYFISKLNTVSHIRNHHRFVADIKTVQVHNFLSIKGTTTFSYENLGYGTFLVKGKNGSGKTLLADAISWCLFGQLNRPSKLVNEVVNNHVQPLNCHVEVTFRNGYKIIRSRAGKSSLKIRTPDNTVIQEGTVPLTEKCLHQLLNIDWESFKRICILTSDTVSQFFNHNDISRTKVLETMLGFDIFQTTLQEVVKDIESNQSKQTELKHQKAIVQSELDHYQMSMQQLSNKALIEDSQISRLQTEMVQFDRIISELRNRFSQVLEDLQKLSEEETNLLSVIKDVNHKIPLVQSDINSCAQSIQRIQSVKDRINHHLQRKQQIQADLVVLTDKYKSRSNSEAKLRLEIEKLEGQSTVATERLNETRNRQASIRDLREQLHTKHMQCLDFCNQQREALDVSLSKLSDDIQRITAQITLHEKEIQRKSDIQSEILKAQRSLSDRQKKDSLLNISKALKELIEKLPTDDLKREFKDRVRTPLIKFRKSLPVDGNVELLKSQIDSLTDSLKKMTLTDNIDSLRIERDELERQYHKLRAERQTLSDEHTRQRDEINAECALHEDIHKLDDDLKQSEKSLQMVNNELEQSRLEITKLSSELSFGIEQIKRSEEDITKEDEHISKYEAESQLLLKDQSFEDLQSQFSDLTEQLRKLQKKVSKSEKKLDTIRQTISDQKTIRKEITSELHSTEQNLASKTASLKTVQSHSVSINEDIEKTSASIAQKSDQISDIDDQLRYLSDLLVPMTFWKTALNDTSKGGATFRKFCISRYLPVINQNIQYNLDILAGDSADHLECRLNESLELEAVKGAIGIGQASQGEHKKRQLALMFSLLSIVHHNSAFETHFMFLDELHDALDSFGRASVERWISDYKQRRPDIQSFIITHMDWDDNESVTDVITVQNGKYITKSGKVFAN